MAAFFFVFFVFLFLQGGLAEICVENDYVYPILDDVHWDLSGKNVWNYRSLLTRGGQDVSPINYRRGLIDSDLGLYNRRGGLYRHNVNVDLPYHRDVKIDLPYRRDVNIDLPYRRDVDIVKDVHYRDVDSNKDIPLYRDLSTIYRDINVRDVPVLHSDIYSARPNAYRYGSSIPTYMDWTTKYGRYLNRDYDVLGKVDHRRFDYRNDVGDFLVADEIVDKSDYTKHFLVKSDVDRSYRMDFFKDNFLNPKSRNECGCVCPNTIPKGDLTNAIVLDIVQKDLLNKLWNNKYMPKLTLLGKRMKFAILNLANSDVAVYKKHALAMSIIFYSYFPHYDLELELCPFTKVVDSFIAYKKLGDIRVVHESIDILGRTLIDAVQLIGSSAMYNSRCGIIKPDISRHTCVEDDRLYHFEDMWQLEGLVLPEFYRRAVYDLYRSDLYQDRLMAAIATAALSPQVNLMIESINVYPLFELVNIQATGIVPDCCCSQRMHRLHKLMGISVNEISRSVHVVKDLIVKV